MTISIVTKPVTISDEKVGRYFSLKIINDIGGAEYWVEDVVNDDWQALDRALKYILLYRERLEKEMQ